MKRSGENLFHEGLVLQGEVLVADGHCHAPTAVAVSLRVRGSVRVCVRECVRARMTMSRKHKLLTNDNKEYRAANLSIKNEILLVLWAPRQIMIETKTKKQC